MRVTLLGTGAAGGVPLYGCDCAACVAARGDPGRVRRPCSALVEQGDTRVLIDAGLTDLHERFPPGSLSAIVLTHFHVDHVQGLFHWRWGTGEPIPVYAPPDSEGCADLYRHPGIFRFHRLRKFEPLRIGPLVFTPLPLIHSRPTLGALVEGPGGARLAYLTDTCGLPPAVAAHLRAQPPDGVVVDCSHPPGTVGRNHNDLDAAVELIHAAGAARGWLTHISHAMDGWLQAHPDDLPPGIAAGHDGLVFDLPPVTPHRKK